MTRSYEDILELTTQSVRSVGNLTDEAEVSTGSRLQEDLDLDSIDIVEVLTKVEDELGVRLSDNELAYENVTSVGDLAERVRELTATAET